MCNESFDYQKSTFSFLNRLAVALTVQFAINSSPVSLLPEVRARPGERAPDDAAHALARLALVLRAPQVQLAEVAPLSRVRLAARRRRYFFRTLLLTHLKNCGTSSLISVNYSYRVRHQI